MEGNDSIEQNGKNLLGKKCKKRSVDRNFLGENCKIQSIEQSEGNDRNWLNGKKIWEKV